MSSYPGCPGISGQWGQFELGPFDSNRQFLHQYHRVQAAQVYL